MLAVKSILAAKSNLPTIIFDEIDTGVSGDVADKMGSIMKEMGNYMQIFAITHLPQVASKGNQHFKVTKRSEERRVGKGVDLGGGRIMKKEKIKKQDIRETIKNKDKLVRIS